MGKLDKCRSSKMRLEMLDENTEELVQYIKGEVGKSCKTDQSLCQRMLS